MSVTRKQREILAREEMLLDVAQEMLVERGYIGITMDRIAAASEYSKGTIYQHFANKEDLLAALAVRTGEMRAALFERAATFRGGTRERMGAIGAAAQLFMRLYPHHEQAEKIIKAQSIREKVSPKRREELANAEHRCLGAAFGIARDALAHEDLQLAEGRTVETLVFGLWSLYIGSFLIMDLDLPTSALGGGDPREMLLENAQLLLDGVGWSPLSSEFDYFASRERALREIFPDEAERAGLIQERRA